MFSLQPSDGLVFGTPTTSQGDQIQHDLIVDQYFMEGNLISFSTGSNNRHLEKTANLGFRRRRKESRDDCNVRKIMHRNIERKRRQEMSNLYDSLRSLLPLKHKGKLSACGQIQEAVNYIKEMQKSIQELRIQRDELKKRSNLSGTGVASSDDIDNLPNCVTVNIVPDGVEILISRSFKSSDLGLSGVLAGLLEIELDVVSCFSTRMKERFLYKILIKAADMTSFEVSVLQDRLTKAIK